MRIIYTIKDGPRIAVLDSGELKYIDSNFKYTITGDPELVQIVQNIVTKIEKRNGPLAISDSMGIEFAAEDLGYEYSRNIIGEIRYNNDDGEFIDPP